MSAGAAQSTRPERRQAIETAVGDIRTIMAADVSVASITRAKAVLMALASRRELFTFEDYAKPDDGSVQRTYLIHEDPDGRHALYVNVGMPGQRYRPHDHGGAWAIIAAVTGAERHRLYTRTANAGSPVELAATIDVQPGTALSMLPDGIHSIEALGETPLLHLHLYARAFDQQDARTEYDLDTGAVESFQVENVGDIIDARD